MIRASGEPAKRAAERLIAEQLELDAIDLAYFMAERPLFVLREGRHTSQFERRKAVEALAKLSETAVICLSDSFKIELIGPQFPHPFELSHWADDGGKV